MDKEIVVSTEEELILRKSFEFGSYITITQYLAKTYGLSELGRFARFWGETAASSRRGIVTRSKQEFLEFEAKIEKAWVGRGAEKLDVDGYIGVVGRCPIRLMSNQHREDLPIDYFCDHICPVMYPYGYQLLGFRGNIEKLNEGCRLIIQC
jgi:hypothetical protein